MLMLIPLKISRGIFRISVESTGLGKKTVQKLVNSTLIHVVIV